MKEREKGAKVWFTIQMPVELRDSISAKAKRDKVNASEFFRRCGEIFVETSSIKEALKKIEKLAASMKLTGTVSKSRKHLSSRKSRVVMPDRANLA
jgi:hypothetical protein